MSSLIAAAWGCRGFIASSVVNDFHSCLACGRLGALRGALPGGLVAKFLCIGTGLSLLCTF